MFDPERLLGQMLGGSLGGALGGKRGRGKRSAFSTGSIGGKATLGIGMLGIAMAAWEHYQQKSAAGTAGPGTSAPAHTGAMPPPAPSLSSMPPPPPPPASAMPSTRPMPLLDERQQSIVLLIRAMIAAANADGHIDASEREVILGRAREGGLDADTLAFLDAELARPQTLQQVVANAKPELAAELYAASAIAITVDTDAEKQWLDMLAYGLRLDPQVRGDIDKQVATPV